MRLFALPPAERRLIVYSEGRPYWTHLRGLVAELLATSPVPLCYVSSDPADPGLALAHPSLRTFEIGSGAIRDWLFANLPAGLVVMTMPDLDRYQVKRSRHPVRYVYAQHSLVSLHVAYRPGAFDHYDVIFSAGPHHDHEAAALLAAAGTSGVVMPAGYSRLDALIGDLAADPVPTRGAGRPHVLVAPSWGSGGLIETQGEAVVGHLLQAGHAVRLRPHPQTSRLSPGAVAAVMARYGSHPDFAIDSDPNGWASLRWADTMVSDWSGAAFDFALSRLRPVVFVDLPPKVNNPGWQDLGLVPVEAAGRADLGEIVRSGLDGLADAVTRAVDRPDLPCDLRARFVHNVGYSDRVAAARIVEMLGKGAA